MTKKRQGADIRDVRDPSPVKETGKRFLEAAQGEHAGRGRVDKSQRKLSEQYKQHTMDTYVLTQYVSISKLFSIVG